MKKLKNILLSILYVICLFVVFGCENEEDITPEIKSETITSKIDQNKVSSFWSPWLISNPNGVIRPSTIFSSSNTDTVILQVREQAGFGIVNLQLVGKNQDVEDPISLGWTTTNSNGISKFTTVNFGEYVIGIQVKEQFGYGIVDARLYSQNYSPTSWVTNNPNVNDFGTYFAPNGHKITGIQVKEQAGFGIVDLRVFVRPVQ